MNLVVNAKQRSADHRLLSLKVLFESKAQKEFERARQRATEVNSIHLVLDYVSCYLLRHMLGTGSHFS